MIVCSLLVVTLVLFALATSGAGLDSPASCQQSLSTPVAGDWGNDSWQARLVDLRIECGYIRVDDLVELASECSDAGRKIVKEEPRLASAASLAESCMGSARVSIWSFTLG